MDKIIGLRTCYEDGTKSVQVWNATTGEQVGEFLENSPKIPEGCSIYETKEFFNYVLGLYKGVKKCVK